MVPETPTRQALLTAGAEIFTRKGLHDARIIDVTTYAKVAAGSFYTHFSSKEALFLALVESMRARSCNGLPTARFVDIIGAREWLMEVVRIHALRLADHIGLWRMINAGLLGNAELSALASSHADPLHQLLESEFALWIERRWIHPRVPCAIVVDALLALTEQTIQQQQWEGRDARETGFENLAAAWIMILRMSSPPPEAVA